MGVGWVVKWGKDEEIYGKVKISKLDSTHHSLSLRFVSLGVK